MLFLWEKVQEMLRVPASVAFIFENNLFEKISQNLLLAIDRGCKDSCSPRIFLREICSERLFLTKNARWADGHAKKFKLIIPKEYN